MMKKIKILLGEGNNLKEEALLEFKEVGHDVVISFSAKVVENGNRVLREIYQVSFTKIETLEKTIESYIEKEKEELLDWFGEPFQYILT